MIYVFNKNKVNELIDKLEKDDIVEISGEDLINLLNAKNNGNKGRKPIQVDLTLFEEIISQWQNGEITARQAMQTLRLKPNTFYRRIKEFKERSTTEMLDIKEELKDIKNRVHEDAEEIKQSVGDLNETLDIEREIRLGKIGAKIDHAENVLAMKRAVKKEAEEYKGTKE